MIAILALFQLITSSEQIQVLAQGQLEDQCKVDAGTLSTVDTNYGWVNAIYDFGQGIVVGLQSPLSTAYLNIIVKVYNEGFMDILSSNATTILREQAGAIVLLVVGAVFVVGFPVAGLFFCCCRSCDNCGAKKKHKPSKCALFSYLLILLTALCFIVVSAAIYGMAVENTSANVDTLQSNTENILNDVRRVLAAASNDVSCHITSYVSILFRYMKSVVHSVPDNTFRTFEIKCGYDTMKEVISYIVTTSQDFSTANSSIINAVNLLRNLRATDESAQSEISSKVTILQQLQNLLPTIKQNYLNVDNEVRSTFDIVDRTINNTKTKVYAAIKEADTILDNTEEKIVSITEDVNRTILEVLSQIDRVSEKVQSIEQQINKFPQRGAIVAGAKAIVIIPCILLALPALITLTCGLIRLPQNDKYPSQGPKCFGIGGFTATFAIAVAFLLGWLVMVVADIAFVGGYSVGLVCKPLFLDIHMQLFSMIPELNFQIPDVFGNQSEVIEVNMGGILTACKNYETIFKAFKGDSLINVDAIMNRVNLIKYRNDAVNQLSQYPLNYTFDGNGLTPLKMSVSTLHGAWSNFDPTLAAVQAAGENNATAVENTEEALRNVSTTVMSLLIKANITINDVQQVVDGAYSAGNFTSEGTY
uniref:Uncharacterized protein n=1 Tax=Parascaris univalens TaxID=6257 RepID=A0A915ALX2_PARUN